MTEIKFEYIFKRRLTPKVVVKKIWSINNIESGHHLGYDIDMYELIAKRQYAGRKDKNGAEIYNGDIISLYTKSEHLEEEDWNIYKGEVKMVEGQWVIFDGKTNQPLFGFEDVEILGNKHENPELLEKNIEVDEV